MGKMTENMLAAMSQFDNDMRSDRTVAGMKAAIEVGRWPFQAPLGYLNAPESSSKGLLVHDSERLALVRQAFQLYGTGTHSKADVLRRLTSSGLKTVKGNRVTPQTFDALLGNEIYAGWLVAFGLRERAKFEPIVSDELFQRVQRVLSGKALTVTPHLRNHPRFSVAAILQSAIRAQRH